MTPSPLLGVPGAVGETIADHYGDPVAEQRALAAGRAVVDLSDRGVVTVSGPDRLRWLDSLTSQALADLRPGVGVESLLLDPHGHLEHAMHVLDDGETTWLIVEGVSAPSLTAWLDRMRFMMQVEVADVSAQWAVLGVMLPDPATTHTNLDPTTHTNPDPTTGTDTDRTTGTAALAVEPATSHAVPLLWRDPWAQVQTGGWQYAVVGEHPGAEYRAAELLVPRADLAALADRARAGEVRLAGSLAHEALRVAAWRPRFAAESDDKSIPHELDWIRSAVHLAKGCYRGQETVAKVHNLGRPPRRLVMLHLDGSDALLPAAGSPVLRPDADRTGAERTEVGHITSSARHHELGPIALAVVKRSLDASLPLVVPVDGVDVAAAQEVIVPPEAGATAGVPRLPRLGATRR